MSISLQKNHKLINSALFGTTVLIAAVCITNVAHAQISAEPVSVIVTDVVESGTPVNNPEVNPYNRPKPAVLPNIQERRDQTQDIRNKILEDKRIAEEKARNERKNAFEVIKIDRKDNVAEIRRDMPTSSRERNALIKDVRQNALEQRKEVRATYKKDEFAARKTALVARLNAVLTQLTNAYTKISARVEEAESTGKNVGDVPQLLDEAADKIDVARSAVSDLVNYTPTPSTATTSTDVNPEEARKVGEAAIQAVKDAHAALKRAITTLVEIVRQAPAQTSNTTNDATDDSAGTTN